MAMDTQNVKKNPTKSCWYYQLFHVLPFQIQEMLKLVGLEKQSATFSKDLSGGQQRKLCVAMAIIGDPKVCDVGVIGMMGQTTFSNW